MKKIVAEGVSRLVSEVEDMKTQIDSGAMIGISGRLKKLLRAKWALLNQKNNHD